MLNVYRLTFLCLLSLAARAQLTPTAAIIQLSPNLCTGQATNFSVSTNASPTSYTWSIFTTSGVQFLSDVNSPSVSISFSKDFTYTLSISMDAPSGALVSKKLIQISRTAIASFYANLSEPGPPTELQLTNYSSNSIKNYWIFQPENTTDSSFNLSKSYSKGGLYSVKLLAVGSRSCNTELTYSFQIADFSSVSIPNIFTPNNDGANDHFKPLAQGLSALTCKVFTREGILLYEWNTVDGFWDGRTTAGEPCSDGVYFYTFEAMGFDGKEYKLSGNLTLLR